MNTVLIVNATIGFSEHFFLVNIVRVNYSDGGLWNTVGR